MVEEVQAEEPWPRVVEPEVIGPRGARKQTNSRWKSVSEALRWRLKKQPKLALALADVLLKQALDSKASGSDRMKAMAMILERMEGTAVARKDEVVVETKSVVLGGSVPEGLNGTKPN